MVPPPKQTFRYHRTLLNPDHRTTDATGFATYGDDSTGTPSRLPPEVPDRMSPGATHSTSRTSRRMVLAVALLFGITSVATLATPARSLAWDGNAYDSSAESELVALTNRARANAGLKVLKVDSTLHTVARWRSKDMITNDYFSHDIPGWGHNGVFPYLSSIGYCYKIAGENIGWNTYPDDQATAQIQQMFMDSPAHRSNILGSSLGRDGGRRLQGCRRQEDVHGPVRRQVRHDA